MGISKKEERIGAKNKNTDGITMVIVEYENCDNITIEFEDGERVKTMYSLFLKGYIKHPNKIKNHKKENIGATNKNKEGLLMKIVEYRKFSDIDVMFEDGEIREHMRLSSFKDGSILHTSKIKNYKEVRLGEIRRNKQGCEMKIVEYKNANEIRIKFLDSCGYEKSTQYQHFVRGEVTNPFYKAIYGVGYNSGDKHSKSKDGLNTKKYDCWHDMLRRCYSEESHIRQPTYIDIEVCEEWHNFQNFGDWFDENYYEVEDEVIQLDKDILIKGNKVYLPNTCVFVPKAINTLFTKRQNHRGDYPIGVKATPYDGYYSSCSNLFLNKQIHLGTYSTPEQAFQAYKEYKENHIKEVADHYKDKIPKKLYDAMYRYEVEITD